MSQVTAEQVKGFFLQRHKTVRWDLNDDRIALLVTLLNEGRTPDMISGHVGISAPIIRQLRKALVELTERGSGWCGPDTGMER